jgi:choline dehydrogenase-like flavoprotein
VVHQIGGPAGSVIAYNLSRSAKKPSVLLVEAGSTNAHPEARVDGKRWLALKDPGMNWGYKTAPQSYGNNQIIDYSRGRGIGGSSAINFGIWTVGAKDDYDQWARLVEVTPSTGKTYRIDLKI